MPRAAHAPPTTRVALLANPASGTCDPEACAGHLRAAGAEVEVFEIEEVERAVAAEPDRIVVAGGDGSIAPVAAAAGAAGVPLGLIPAGTANDFARRMNVPRDLEAAARLVAQGTETRAMELGWLGERPFVNVGSAGLPAPAARRASAWKRTLGSLGYAAGAAVAGLTARALPVRVVCDDETLFEGDAWQVTVAASGAFGAGAHIAEADPHDGALEVLAIEAGPRPGLVALAYRLRSGTLSRHRRAHHRRCRAGRLELPPGTELNVDGEVIAGGPLSFRGQADAFGLVVA